MLACLQKRAFDAARIKKACHFVTGFVATPGIEPGLRASETHVLSIVLRG